MNPSENFEIPSKSRIRDLILHFFTKHDPKRLNAGIDVNGMVNWTFDNGISALNSMLNQRYGEIIDPLDTTNFNTARNVAAVSTAVSGRMAYSFNDMRREIIRDKIQRFYQKVDPSKLNCVPKLVEYVIHRGESALNDKLRRKYGEDLTSYSDDASSVSSLETLERMTNEMDTIKGSSGTPSVLVSPEFLQRARLGSFSDFQVSSMKTVAVIEEKGILHDLRTDKDSLEIELKRFYHKFDPSKLAVLEGLVIWALQIGRKDFNKKLVQLYGVDLDSTPPPVKPKKLSQRQQTESMKQQESRIDKPRRKRRKNKNKRRTDQSVAKEKVGVEGNLCNSYELDMTNAFFGICKCGNSKLAHKS